MAKDRRPTNAKSIEPFNENNPVAAVRPTKRQSLHPKSGY